MAVEAKVVYVVQDRERSRGSAIEGEEEAFCYVKWVIISSVSSIPQIAIQEIGFEFHEQS